MNTIDYNLLNEIQSRVQIIRRKLFENAECRLAALLAENDRMRSAGVSFEERERLLEEKGKSIFKKIVDEYKNPISFRNLGEVMDIEDLHAIERMGIDTFVAIYWQRMFY